MAITLLASSTIVNAAVVDFNSLEFNTDPEGYTEQGVTFSSSGGNFFVGLAPNLISSLRTKALVSQGDGEFMSAAFSSTVSSVSVDLGDARDDADRLFLSVFDSSDNLLGSVTKDINDTFTGMETLSLSFSNIAYANFGSTGELGRGGIFADNFTFDSPVSQVPIPAAAFLFGTGLLGLIGVARRKKA